jgi:hypothetical protein
MKTPAEEQKGTAARLELASVLFHEFYASCFWHMKPELIITEELIPLIIKGLRTHGGRRGLLSAARLEK